jgi:hypothetical protein
MTLLDRRDILRMGALPLVGGVGRRAPGKNVIFLKLTGGPSQLDTFDPKPDAPSAVRSPYRPIETNVPGIRISELFPRMARHADKYALIRSCYHTAEPTHEAAPRIAPTGGATLSGGSFAENCLRARRLIESGRTRFVTVEMFETLFNRSTWDIHGFAPFSPMSAYRDHVAPMFDTAFSALLQDLHDRGLLSTTLVVATGEFGRTPKINPAGGRDHWPECWTTVIAGGGVTGGQVIGSSDKIGAEPKDRPVSAEELAATIDYAVGQPALAGARPVLELFG